MFSRRFRNGLGAVAAFVTAMLIANSLFAQDDSKDPSESAVSREAREPASPPAPESKSVDRVIVRDLREIDENGEGRRWPEISQADPYGHSYTPLYGVRYGHSAYPAWKQWFEMYQAIRRAEHYDRRREFNAKDMAARKERLLSQHEEAVQAGVRRMKEGQYAQALTALKLAERLNHADAACRIHLAQTQLALGHYAEAGTALRRGLQLQPQLVYMDLHLDRYYQVETEFGEYADGLAGWLRRNAAEPEVYFLHGYLEFQRGDRAAAWRAFSRVKEVLPKDDLTREYMELTKPAFSPKTASAEILEGNQKD